MTKDQQTFTPEQRLRKRLTKAGIEEKAIDCALSEWRRREQIHNRRLRDKLKALKKQLSQPREQPDGNVAHAPSVGSETPAGGCGHPVDGLAGIRGEFRQAIAALMLAAEKFDSKNLSDSVFGLQRAIKYMIWVLCIGTGIMVSGIALLFAFNGV